MRRRNVEFVLLLFIATVLCVETWHAANQCIDNRILAMRARAPVHILSCSPEQLLNVLKLRFTEPALGATQRAILEWRAILSTAELRTTVLADLRKLTGPSGKERLLSDDTLRFLRPFWITCSAPMAREAWLWTMGGLVAIFLLAHLVFRVSRFEGNQGFLPIVFFLSGFSTILLFTFRDPLRDRALYLPFAIGVGIGCAAMVLIARFLKLQRLENYKYLIGIAALTLSILLVVLGTGPAGTDARINLFGFQPVELIKILVVLFLASYFSGKDVELRRLDAGQRMGVPLPRKRDAMPVAIFVGCSLGLFFLQKDLGPALILYLVFLGMFMVASRRIFLGLAGLAVLVSAFWAAYQYRLLQTVATRIEMWLHPWDNARAGGVQLAESLWALASGGFWGSGLGRGVPAYIPAGHTDLILSATGEALGFPGLMVSLCALVLLFLIIAYQAWRTRDKYSAYLGMGIVLLLGIQTAVIAAGTVGLLPLTGVPLPFMSFGKSSTIASFVLVGFVLNISAKKADTKVAQQPIPLAAMTLPGLIILLLGAVAWRSYDLMTNRADKIVCMGALTPQADRVRRYSYNRRLLDIVSEITRGDILDRNGNYIATSRRDEMNVAFERARALGMETAAHPSGGRFYTLGSSAVQLLGNTKGLWVDPRTIERSMDATLRGYPNKESVVLVDGAKIVQRDMSSLVPVYRDRFLPSGGKLHRLMEKNKDVRLTLDARLQVAAARALEHNLPTINGVARSKGAGVVLRASTGEVLACVSMPTYDPNHIREEDAQHILGSDTKAAYDRARFEIYPPGSTFKVVTAAAALERGWQDLADSQRTFTCSHVNPIPWEYGGGRHVRNVTDDEAESAHGRIDLRRALVESCNVYFAWLGTRIGAANLFEFAHNRLRFELKGVETPDDLQINLPDNSYGQAKITVSPLRMASLAAAVVNGGYWIEPNLVLGTQQALNPRVRVLKESTASTLRDWMMQVVQIGTGRKAAVTGVTVGGKTGTAQNEIGDKTSHSWFIGFAYPEDPSKAVAFAFLIENGGYGGRAAAMAAHDFIRECFPRNTENPAQEAQR
jgi:cell division protein FtsW (lipid II flippase)/beta-lactamase class D